MWPKVEVRKLKNLRISGRGTEAGDVKQAWDYGRRSRTSARSIIVHYWPGEFNSRCVCLEIPFKEHL
ncbi:unnamed protein product [Calypogeia fissa]